MTPSQLETLKRLPCTCLKDGSAFCKFPHPCRRCYSYHPGVSCYWNAHGKSEADKQVASRTFERSDGSIGCDECCTGDRCDDPTHYDRENCPFCLGSGTPKIEDKGLESVEDIAERTFPEEVAWLRRNKDSLVPHIDSDRTVGKTDWDRECQESGRLNRGKTW